MDPPNQLTILIGALMTGFLAGFGHCIGMCGPLVSTTVLDASRRTLWQKTVAQLLYHMGRITTYAWVGALMGWTGSFVNVAGSMVGIQNAVALFAGIFMALRGLELLGVLRWKLIERVESHIGFLLHGVRPLQMVDSVWRYYLLGLFLGLLPCGVSYSAFLGAAGTGGAASGFLFTFTFGLGTIPALFLLGTVVGSLSVNLRGWLYRAGGVSLFLLGLLFLYDAVKGMIHL